MTYALIGSGNMAWLIASRMLSAGHACTGAWGRNAAATDELCSAFKLPRMLSLADLQDGPDACIIAVTDAAIAEVVRSLSLQRTTLIHTAGSMPLDVLTAHCVHAGVVWPVYSVRKAALPAHRGFAALVEANTDHAGTVVRAVAHAVCDTAYEADGRQRLWMHLAAVIGNNFINHMMGVAADICAAHDLPAGLLQPLLEQTFAGTPAQPPSLRQTGPARRHDLDTIARHRAMLEAHPQWQQLYDALTKAIMDRFPLPAKG